MTMHPSSPMATAWDIPAAEPGRMASFLTASKVNQVSIRSMISFAYSGSSSIRACTFGWMTTALLPGGTAPRARISLEASNGV